MGVATRNNHKFYEIVVLISLCLSCAYCIVVVEKSWTHSYINIWNKYKYFFVVGFWREIQITKNIVGPRVLTDVFVICPKTLQRCPPHLLTHPRCWPPEYNKKIRYRKTNRGQIVSHDEEETFDRGL